MYTKINAFAALLIQNTAKFSFLFGLTFKVFREQLMLAKADAKTLI